MNQELPTTGRRRRLAFLVPALSAPCHCYAAVVFMDLGGLVGYVALYLLGIVLFPALIFWFSKEKVEKRFWKVVFAFFALGPILLVLAEFVSEGSRQSRIQKDAETYAEELRQVAGDYCSARKRRIDSRRRHEGGASVLIRIEKGFTGYVTDFDAHKLSQYLRGRSQLCVRTGVSLLEGIFEARAEVDGRGPEREVHRFPLCHNGEFIVDAAPIARYELVLGRVASRHPHWGTTMSRSSAQVVDRLTGEILAEDMLYFIKRRDPKAVSGCPDPMDQLSELLVAVFGSA